MNVDAGPTSNAVLSERNSGLLRAGFVGGMPRRIRELRESLRVVETSNNGAIRNRAMSRVDELISELMNGCDRYGFPELRECAVTFLSVRAELMAAPPFTNVLEREEVRSLLDSLYASD